MSEDYQYLCAACGGISPADTWPALDRGEEGELVAAAPGSEAAIMLCPLCKHEHVDDDSNPGIYDGTMAEVRAERARLVAEETFEWARRCEAEFAFGGLRCERDHGHPGPHKAQPAWGPVWFNDAGARVEGASAEDYS